jgi:hypothetical protein
MKNYNKNKQEPQFNSTQEVLKIIATIAATILIDKVGRVISDVTNSSSPRLIDAHFREEER